MVNPKVVKKQLDDINCNFMFFGKPELRELPNILQPGEVIAQVANGWYEGGFATFCVTTDRLLVIDRKLFALTIEDIRYDLISEVDRTQQLLSSEVHVYTPNKSLRFMSYDSTRLRRCVEYVQQRVMEIRRAQQQRPDMHAVEALAEQAHQQQSKTPAMLNHPIHWRRHPGASARLALSALDRYIQHVPHTSLPLFRRRRYPSFYSHEG